MAVPYMNWGDDDLLNILKLIHERDERIRKEAQEELKPKDQKPRYAVGVSVLLTQHAAGEKRLLLGRRKNNTAAGWFSTPGGRIEYDETVIEAATREFREETGAWIYPGELKIVDVALHNRFDDHYVIFYVHAPSFGGVITNTEPDKNDGWLWYRGWEIVQLEHVTEPPSVLAKLGLTWTRENDECQAWIGADDICGLPESSPIHDLMRGTHRFVRKVR